MASEQDVLALKRKYSAQWLRQPGVCGVGVEKDQNGHFVLSVHLDPTHAGPENAIPDSVEGCPVRRIASGPFVKR